MHRGTCAGVGARCVLYVSQHAPARESVRHDRTATAARVDRSPRSGRARPAPAMQHARGTVLAQ
eukprot:2586054-Lingulodinium_polyedra.AAC.1